MRFRLATQGDAQALLDIYAQYIDTPITFECVLPSLEAFKERIASIQAFYPYIVAEENGRILGYAYAHRHMEREAYQWNAELSVYLDRTCTSLGIGTLLVTRLIQILKLQGILKVTSGITQPNEKSDGLHKKLGFRLVGTYDCAGFKAGKWYNVSWFQKDIGEHTLVPHAPVGINEVSPETIEEILKA